MGEGRGERDEGRGTKPPRTTVDRRPFALSTLSSLMMHGRKQRGAPKRQHEKCKYCDDANCEATAGLRKSPAGNQQREINGPKQKRPGNFWVVENGFPFFVSHVTADCK